MILEFCYDTFESNANFKLELLKSTEFHFCATEDTICHT